MIDPLNFNDNQWPPFSAHAFAPTSHLLYMCIQMLGKCMLKQPFKPHWANLAMPLTSRGISTGIIPYQSGVFSVELDCFDHILIFTSSFGKKKTLQLESMSVSTLYEQLFRHLEMIGVTLKINKQPQEMSNPIPFDQDLKPREYDKKVVNTWWRILLSTYRVLMIFHSRYYGITPRIGLLWGTLDLRDARYKGAHLEIAKDVSNYIGRNAMDYAQFEVGFSASNEKYLTPSFFAFAYPKPEGYERMFIQPESAKWIPSINEFVLDYDDLLKSKDPENDLLKFFESSYLAFAKLAGWDPTLIVSGKPLLS